MCKILILKPIILGLRLLNLVSYHFSEIKEKFKPNDWAQELSLYFKTKPEQISKVYQQKRKETVKLWDKIKRQQISQIYSFYSETDYFVYRQSHFNRHKSWWDIALGLVLNKKNGRLCEYGAGIGPVTNWLIRKFPNWNYHLIDLDCPTFRFSRWRFKNNKNVSFSAVKSLKPPLTGKYDVIVCKQVLEHVPNPYLICQKFVRHLNLGGWLFIDFINCPGQENLDSSYQERSKTLKYLAKHLKPVFNVNKKGKTEGYGLYLK